MDESCRHSSEIAVKEQRMRSLHYKSRTIYATRLSAIDHGVASVQVPGLSVSHSVPHEHLLEIFNHDQIVHRIVTVTLTDSTKSKSLSVHLSICLTMFGRATRVLLAGCIEYLLIYVIFGGEPS
jgi:hypothetical protein